MTVRSRSVRYRSIFIAAILLLSASASAAARELRVCADPNNMPFSDRQEQGFENRLVALLAQDLNASVRYVWWAQRRGNIRNTLKEDVCDLVPGVSSSLEMLDTTRPYYRSAYMFVTRRDRKLHLTGFDDDRLRRLSIGVQMIGDDFSNTPPAHSLTNRGIVGNVRGYMVYGNYADAAPARAIVDAVAAGNVDVAIVWGPTAGYFAADSASPLLLEPVQPLIDGPMLPMAFDISMGVRKGDRKLRRELDAALDRNRDAIAKLLREFHVPLIER
jgi:mxaJ protein